MLLSIFLISLVIKNAEPFECNATTEFRCSNKCIPLEWRCDNIPDCSDNTDELGCNYVHQCRVGMMMCRDGTCIAQSFKCDGEADCIDGHDEHSCENVDLSHLRNRDEAPQYYNTAAECTSPKKLCKTGGQCLSETAVCDGIKDCPDGDDEEGCLKPLDPTTNLLSKPSDQPCSYGHKKCASDDVCIPSYWICDGSEDCSDGSDELNCDGGDEERDVQSNNALCKHDEYRCEGESGKCIPREFQCNGTPDCPHADDESEKKCHDCLSRHCAHKCRLTDFGGECYCPHGSKLNDDGETCTPINFCETDDAKMCQHFCSSHESGYKCSCAAQYVLGDDSHSCHVEKKSEGHILSEVCHCQTLRIRATVILKAEGSHGAAAIVNDTEKILRQNIVGIENIAFDYVGKNIYYTQKYPAKKPGIYVCTVDGLFCKRIVTGNPAVEGDTAKRQSYRGLALNPLSGKMVWIEHYNHKHKIMIANMDGSDAKMLLDNKLEEPQGIAFDPIKDEVYYADFSTTSIEKINLKTKERSVVVSRGVHHPFDLKYFDGYLYWSDWGTESLKSVEISKVHSSAQTLHSFRQFPMGLAIKHPNYQAIPSVNPCELMDKTCRWMCVPISGYQSGELKAQCVCPDGYKYEEGTCIPGKAFALDDGDSYIGTIYMEELCTQGTACQSGGECRKSASHGLQRIYCSCPASFTGERCEISDPHAKPLVKDDDVGSSSWTVFWFLFCIFTLMVAAFAFLYHKSRTVNQFTRTTLAHLESPDLSGLRPIVNNVKTKLQSLPSRVSASTGRFTHTHVEESSEAESAFVQPTVTFNNPMYLENPPTRRTSSSESSITWSDPTTLKMGSRQMNMFEKLANIGGVVFRYNKAQFPRRLAILRGVWKHELAPPKQADWPAIEKDFAKVVKIIETKGYNQYTIREGMVYAAVLIERNFTRRMYNHVHNFDVEGNIRRTIHPLASTSIADMLEEFCQFNFKIIFIGDGLMLIYAMFTQYKHEQFMPSADSCMGLALIGVLTVTFASVSGLGLATWFGIEFNAATTQIVPFLTLGIGVDNMFMLLHNYHEVLLLSNRHEIGILMKETGMSILCTSINNMLSFLAGTLLPIPALRPFCAQSSILLTFNFIAILTMYPAMIAIDLRRRKAGRRDICCCLYGNTCEEEYSTIQKPQPQQKRTIGETDNTTTLRNCYCRYRPICSSSSSRLERINGIHYC